MRIGERGEGERDEGELPERRADADAHQRGVALARAPERHRRLHDGEREREDHREMAGLDDHGLAVPVVAACPTAPSCQRPCFFSESTTSRGM